MSRGTEQTFFQRRYRNGQQVHEKISPPITRICKSNVMRYHLRSLIMAIIKKKKKKMRNNKCWRGCGEKGTLVNCWWECKFVQSLWKTLWKFLKKVRTVLSHDPAIPLLGIHPKEMKSLSQRDIYTPMFICSIIHNS